MTPELISTDPCTGAEVWRGPVADAADIDRAIADARLAQPRWERAGVEERCEVARRFAAAVKTRSQELASVISRETGKPLWESRTEVESVAGKVDISISAQAERAGVKMTNAGGVRQVVRHRPHGLLAVLGPYNFPAHLPNGHIVPALLAGNALVFKPSELAPATAEMMAALWAEAGLPHGLLTVLQGAGETGRTLAAHPDIDGVLFTGSSATGRALARQFVDTPGKMLALEMGGNNPLLLWDVMLSDMSGAAAIAAQSGYLSAGQRCTAARRLIVQDHLADALLDELVPLIGDLRIGAPFDEPQPFMGPVIDQRAAARIEAQFEHLVRAGGRPLVPLVRPDPLRPFLTPALIDMTGADETEDAEIFGPVLQLFRVADFDAALTRANATRYGLSAALVGGTAEVFARFRHGIRAGVVNWNRPTNGASSALPFGGIGDSGNLRPGAYYAADYCAWPVASLEQTEIEASIAIGRKDAGE